MTSPLRLEIADSLAALMALRSQLSELAAAAGASAFNKPGFFLPWAKAAIASGQTPACPCLFRGTDLVAFAPVFLRRDRKAMLAWRGSLPVYGSSPPFDLLLAPGEETAGICAELAQVLKKQAWLDLSFASQPADSLLDHGLAQAFERCGYPVFREQGPQYLLIRGFSSAEYDAQLKSRHRREFRRRERRLRETCEVDLYTHESDPQVFLPDIRHILRASWKFNQRMQETGLPLYEEQIMGAAQDGTLRVWLVRSGGTPVTFLFELSCVTGTRHAYFTAYSADAGQLGAGGALLYIAVKACMDDGGGQYDLWSDRDNWRRMATGTRNTGTVLIRRKGVLPQLRLTAAGQFRRAGRILCKVKPRPQV